MPPAQTFVREGILSSSMPPAQTFVREGILCCWAWLCVPQLLLTEEDKREREEEDRGRPIEDQPTLRTLPVKMVKCVLVLSQLVIAIRVKK